MTRWSTMLMDTASLGEMPRIPTADVMRHADLVLDRHPGPLELYRRWERQQWSAEELSLDRDISTFASSRLPLELRTTIRSAIATFIIGEYTGLDMLGPIITGSPDESYSLFLGTQIADETRHTRAMFRMGEEILGFDAQPRIMLTQAWKLVTPAHIEISMIEAVIVRNLQRRPSDYGQWLQAVTLFHLITEGVLALIGQRVVVQALRDVNLFDGIKTAFVAMCRDESRHVGFGLDALRTGIREGYAVEIYGVLERAVPVAMRFDHEFNGISTDFGQMSVDILRRHLRLIGADEVFVTHLLAPYARSTRPAPRKA